MPLQIPSTAFTVFAAMLGSTGGQLNADAPWRITDRVMVDSGYVVNGIRRIESVDACLQFARAEAKRLQLGEEVTTSGGPVTHLRFADGAISFSCAQIEPAMGVVAVTGPESALELAGYRFTLEY